MNDYYPHTNPATDLHKPSLIFDGNPNTFYHSRYGSTGPGLKIFFSEKYSISKVKFIPRADNYLNSNEDTIYSIIRENVTEEVGVPLTRTNK